MSRHPEAALSEARRALTARVDRYQDELAQALLDCLELLVALHETLAGDAGPEALKSALGAADELASAARLMTFTASGADRKTPLHPHKWGGVPARPTGPLLEEARGLLGEQSGAVRDSAQALLDPLEELLRDVILAADMQGYVDANANEAAYLRAATRISQAASFAATACRLG